jgi:hypothetical protein
MPSEGVEEVDPFLDFGVGLGAEMVVVGVDESKFAHV